MSDGRIGIVGAGSVGSRLAQRLASLGWAPSVFDHDPPRATALERWGAKAVRVPADVGLDAGMVILDLPDERAVDDAVFDCGGLAETLPQRGVVVNLSRTSVAYGMRANAELDGLGLLWLEAALIGAPAAAERWAVCLAAGASEEECGWVVRPTLLWVASRVTLLEGPGDGMDTVSRIRTALDPESSASIMAGRYQELSS
jgi:L-threonate 2-dehydrogenase